MIQEISSIKQKEIESIKQKEIEYTIIPKLTEWNEIILNPGDTLIMLWDFEEFDADDLNQFHKIVSKAFPDNQVLFIPKGTEIGVIKNEIITAF